MTINKDEFERIKKAEEKINREACLDLWITR